MTSSDYNMLQLEAPRDMLQITDGTVSQENTVELTNPATWVRNWYDNRSKQRTT